MARSILLTVLFGVSLLQAQAQVDPLAPATVTGQECLMATPVATWTTIGADADQLRRIEAVQTLCHTDCSALGDDGKRDPAMSQAIVKKHEEEIARILSAEQFAKWQEFCKGRPERM